MKYLVNEYFQTVQGEGFFTGTPAFFLRLQGCDVGCKFCDTKYTWSMKSKQVPHEELKPNTPAHALMSVEEILEKCGSTRHVVVTGGEPTLQDLSELAKGMYDKRKQMQIETSGTEIIKAHDDTWVTLSPKFGNPAGKKLLQSCIDRANEFKFPVATMEHIHIIDKFFENRNTGGRIVWLQPISQGDEATKICIEEARKRGWRISVQTHKYLGLR